PTCGEKGKRNSPARGEKGKRNSPACGKKDKRDAPARAKKETLPARGFQPMTPTLASLHIYPLKSCAPLALDVGTVEARGLVHDRRWLVTDADGRFLTGREEPRLTLVRALPNGDALHLSAPGCEDLRLVAVPNAARVRVRIWNSEVDAQPGGADADAWISRFLGRPARLFHMDDSCRRAVDPDHSRPGDIVSFADGFPLLLISQSALDDLNARLARPISMLRFRPNVVVAGTAPHAEDEWKRV